MLNDFLASQVHELGVEGLYFQQDDAPCYTSSAIIAPLRQMFLGRLISKFGDITWPKRSPDLISPDFFCEVTKQGLYQLSIVSRCSESQHTGRNWKNFCQNIAPRYEKCLKSSLNLHQR